MKEWKSRCKREDTDRVQIGAIAAFFVGLYICMNVCRNRGTKLAKDAYELNRIYPYLLRLF